MPAHLDTPARPNITLPKDMKKVFEGWKTGDATKDAALADAERALNSVDDAIARGDTKSKALAFYYQDDALLSEIKWVQAWLDANYFLDGNHSLLRPTGDASRQEDGRRHLLRGRQQGIQQETKSGKVDKTSTGESPYTLYNTRLVKNDKGVWQTTGLYTKRGHQQ